MIKPDARELVHNRRRSDEDIIRGIAQRYHTIDHNRTDVLVPVCKTPASTCGRNEL